jgi:hypothetical protein
MPPVTLATKTGGTIRHRPFRIIGMAARKCAE